MQAHKPFRWYSTVLLNKIVSPANPKWLKYSSFIPSPNFSQSSFLNTPSRQAQYWRGCLFLSDSLPHRKLLTLAEDYPARTPRVDVIQQSYASHLYSLVFQSSWYCGGSYGIKRFFVVYKQVQRDLLHTSNFTIT